MAIKTDPLRNVHPVKAITPTNQRGRHKNKPPKLKTFKNGKTARLH